MGPVFEIEVKAMALKTELFSVVIWYYRFRGGRIGLSTILGTLAVGLDL